MGEVVNLRMVRKAKTRSDREATAAANRAKFGRTKVEKQRSDREQVRADAMLDGARREPVDDRRET